jgi:pyridoxal phosphate enzyme (YggS family)
MSMVGVEAGSLRAIMSTLHDRITAVHTRIDTACAAAQRPPGSVHLLCVSKTQPADAVRAAHDLGERHFGENYVQEGLAKIAALAELRRDLTWHFIGPLQSNKSRLVAEAFDWVHSVDSLKLARRLSEQRPVDLPPLNVCLQVNISREATKSGVAPDEVPALAQAVAALPRLVLRGLMSIPAPDDAGAHARLAALRQPGMDTLSMGMSEDLEAAIAAGATWVRVGTALFGPRAARA